jgi:hypothetical protein
MAFFLPAITGPFETPKPHTATGMAAFVLGGVLFPVCTAIWMANPLLWTGLLALRKGKMGQALGYGLAASACALGALAVPQWQLGAGYYLWLGSMFLLTGFAYRAWRGGSPTPAQVGRPGHEDDNAPAAAGAAV